MISFSLHQEVDYFEELLEVTHTSGNNVFLWGKRAPFHELICKIVWETHTQIT